MFLWQSSLDLLSEARLVASLLVGRIDGYLLGNGEVRTQLKAFQLLPESSATERVPFALGAKAHSLEATSPARLSTPLQAQLLQAKNDQGQVRRGTARPPPLPPLRPGPAGAGGEMERPGKREQGSARLHPIHTQLSG